MRATLSILSLALAGSALANPCEGPAPKSILKTTDTWMNAYRIVAGADGTAKDEKQATDFMCVAKPCGPNEPISVVGEMMGLGAAVIFKNPTGYAILKLPVDLPPHAFEADFTRLRPDAVHVSVDFEELGREMFCEKEDLDENGDCVDGRTATVGLGWHDNDFIVNPISRTVTWARSCDVGEDDPHRDSRVRRDGQHFGYESCDPHEYTAWFTLKGGKCALSAPHDVKALLKSARTLASRGDYGGAIAIFEKLVEIEPSSGRIRGERGYLKYKTGDHTGALADFEAARLLDPPLKVLGSIYYNKGLVLLAQGKAKAAVDAFSNADRLRPSKAAKAKLAEAEALLKKK